MKRILVTGGAGKFATNIKKYSKELEYSVIAPAKEDLDITDLSACEKYFFNYSENKKRKIPFNFIFK